MTSRATEIAESGAWSGDVDGIARLDYDARTRRRILIETDAGEPILLDFAETRCLRNGDALLLDDGRRIAIMARSERLMSVRPRDPAMLIRLAWHIGNRHLPTEFHPDHLILRHDHVIADMLHRLGATVEPIESSFDPEGGAYGVGATMGHSHGPDTHHHHD